VSRYTRYPVLLIAASLFIALAAAAQKPESAARPADKDFLPAGPFLFEPGATSPTFMDAFGDRPAVKSPDGKLGVTVTGPKESYGAWVTIAPSAFPDGPVQVWPIQRSVDVLWGPDSQSFALTDNRYANRSYVLLFGTGFRMGQNGPGLGVPITDLTPTVEKAFHKRAQEYYAGQDYDAHHFYAKVLRWIGNEQLLVGVSAITSGPPTFPNRGVRIWNVAYLVDVSHKTVLTEVSESQLLSNFGIKVVM
jgi:hypothetical protein